MGLEVDYLAPASHGGHRALNLAGIDVPPHRRVDPLQPLRGHADRFGLGDGNFTAADRDCGDRPEGRYA